MLKQRGVIDFNANIRLHPEGRSRHGYSRHSYRPVARWHNARFFCVSTVRHVLLPKDGVCRRGSVVDRGSTSLSLSFDPITRRASSIAVIRAINRACDRFHLSIFAHSSLYEFEQLFFARRGEKFVRMAKRGETRRGFCERRRKRRDEIKGTSARLRPFERGRNGKEIFQRSGLK